MTPAVFVRNSLVTVSTVAISTFALATPAAATAEQPTPGIAAASVAAQHPRTDRVPETLAAGGALAR